MADALELHGSLRRSRRAFAAVLAAVAVLAAAAGLWFVHQRHAAAGSVHYETQPVSRGNVVQTVSATGTLAPVKEVEVGSEISGTLKTVEADFNDRVTNGQVLARIDTSKLSALVLQSDAALKAADARVVEAGATLRESEAQLTRLTQVRELSGGKVPSLFEYEAQEAAVARARAGVATAQANVAQAQATLDLNRSDLGKAVIRSPVNGVVLSRQIEPGQTVAASFEAPVLFKLAEDLAQLELQVDVDEADVGQVRAGQSATFTVDAYPDREYPATITQVRYGSKTTEGVVTYTTLLQVSNEDLSLRPGMTATAVINVRKAENVLLVPNAALRFAPPQAPAAAPGGAKPSLVSSLLPHPPHREAKASAADHPGRGAQVHVLRDGQLRALPVKTGLADDRNTEVSGSGLEAGMAVVTGVAAASK